MSDPLELGGTLITATSAWTVISAIGTAVGGLGAAVGAGAAWKAASASRATSRDAMEALGLAIAPILTGDAGISPIRDGTDTGIWRARVFNTSQFAASKLHFEADFEDGVRVEQGLERLAPGETWETQLRVIGMPPGGPLLEQAGKGAVLRYSDERGILRYELRFGFLSRQNPDGTRTPSVAMVPITDSRRI